MRAEASVNPVDPARVTVSLSDDEARVLRNAIGDVLDALKELVMPGYLYGERGCLVALHDALDACVGRGAPVAPPLVDDGRQAVTVREPPQTDSGLGLAVVPAAVPDPSNLEWCVRVFMATQAGVRGTMSLSRPFDSEARARDFFTRTQNVHNAKVRNREAAAYDVVLGTQDSRKHRKAGSFVEVQHAVCGG